MQPIEFSTTANACKFWIETGTAIYEVSVQPGGLYRASRNGREVSPTDPALGVARENFARILALLLKVIPAVNRYLAIADDTQERRELWWNLKNAARHPDSTPTLTQ